MTIGLGNIFHRFLDKSTKPTIKPTTCIDLKAPDTIPEEKPDGHVVVAIEDEFMQGINGVTFNTDRINQETKDIKIRVSELNQESRSVYQKMQDALLETTAKYEQVQKTGNTSHYQITDKTLTRNPENKIEELTEYDDNNNLVKKSEFKNGVLIKTVEINGDMKNIFSYQNHNPKSYIEAYSKGSFMARSIEKEFDFKDGKLHNYIQGYVSDENGNSKIKEQLTMKNDSNYTFYEDFERTLSKTKYGFMTKVADGQTTKTSVECENEYGTTKHKIYIQYSKKGKPELYIPDLKEHLNGKQEYGETYYFQNGKWFPSSETIG